MELPVPIRELFDCSEFALAAHLPSHDSEAWNVDLRQRLYRVHSDTRSILFRWLPNDWTPGAARQIATYDYAPRSLTDAVTACGNAIARHFDGQIVKLMLAELGPGGVIIAHRDKGAALRHSHRCHVPVVTNPQVAFRIDGEAMRLREGIAYEIDNTRLHEVSNLGQTPRVHLICDVMPWNDADV